MTISRLVAFGVFVTAIAALVVGWSIFFIAAMTGSPTVTLYLNYFEEFWIEFLGLTLSVVFLPTLLHEIDRELYGRD